MNLLHHLSIKPEGATGDEQFGLNCRRVLCSHAHGCKRNHGWHGLRFENDKKERSRQRRKGSTLKDIHKLYLQMWYAVLLPELHYRSLWASVTARVWGKLPHYVPGENEISLSSCILEALLSQTVRLIKSSQFGLEFLSQFSQKKKKTHKCNREKATMFHFKSNIGKFPVQTAGVLHLMRSLYAGYLSDDAAGRSAPSQADTANIRSSSSWRLCVCCVSAIYHLYDWTGCLFLSLCCATVAQSADSASSRCCSHFSSVRSTDVVCCCVFNV